jgi:ribosome-binding factor A
LRAGELIRHALVEVLREHEIREPALAGVSVTVTEVRMSPDLSHATCFVEPLGGGDHVEVVKALNRSTRFLRGQLGRLIDMKFTPELRFHHDDTFAEAERLKRLFDDPRVRRDLEAQGEAVAETEAPETENGEEA